MIQYSYRTPWGVASPRPEANAGCRACREGFMSRQKFNIIVDSKDYDGVNFRTMSGGKLSSIKIDFTGVVFFEVESIKGLFIYKFR